jgi:hypothetical protein
LKAVGIIALLLFSLQLLGQGGFFHLHRDFYIDLEKELSSGDSSYVFLSSTKPININEIKDTETFKQYFFLQEIFHSEESSWKHFYSYVFNSSFGVQQGEKNNLIGQLGTGLALHSSFRDKLNFQGDFIYLNGAFPHHFNQYIQEREVIPSLGYAYNSSFDYQTYQANFSVNYQASKYFNLSAGQGRNFFGDGYRSLLLSDFGNPYPYAKIETKVWRIKYTNLFTNYKSVMGSGGNPSNFVNKYSATHFLDWKATKKLSIGLFESVLWQGQDTLINRGFDVNYLNPVIFYRPVEYSTGSPDRVIVGLNLKYEFTPDFHFYGQMVLDEFLLKEIRADITQVVRPDSSRVHGWWGNKYGFQAGLKYFDAFGIENLYLQGEMNLVRPYTYSHGTVYQNYAHFGQPLAHPLESNFFEYLLFIRYKYKKIRVELQSMYAIRGVDLDESENFGGNLYKVYQSRPYEHGHFIGQGTAQHMIYQGIDLNFPVGENQNFNLFLNCGLRFVNDIDSRFLGFYRVGIRTLLYNQYNDF